MDQEEIKQILERYYEGLTTDEEEKLLEKYFSRPDIPAGLEPDREWFRLRRMNIPEPGMDFYTRLASVTENNNREFASGFNIFHTPLRIAAMVALIITGYLFVQNIRSAPARLSETYNDPVVAMAEVQKILSEVSANMNKGSGELSEIKRLGIVPEAFAPFAKASETARKSLESIKDQKVNHDNKK